MQQVPERPGKMVMDDIGLGDEITEFLQQGP